MPTPKRPRHGSLQFYPRSRARKVLPRVNWTVFNHEEEGLLGFVMYKVGMKSAVVTDNTEHSMTKGKKISLPVTILEAPNMKIFSVRFCKHEKPIKDIIVSNDKALKSKLKVPKVLGNLDKVPEHYDDIRIIAYSIPSQTSVKKTPDLVELGISSKDKLNYIKSLMGKEITLNDFLGKHKLFDVRGITTGRGLVGSVKRFGLNLKSHKSEKGVRRAGSLGPWHPARVTYFAPQAGQLGNFTRITYNSVALTSGNIKEKDINPSAGFRHYGKINTNYLILKGSVQGVKKRQLLITRAFRPSYDTKKKKYDFVSLEEGQ